MRNAHLRFGALALLLAFGPAPLLADDPSDGSAVVQAKASTLPKPLGCGCKRCGKAMGACRCPNPCPTSGGYIPDGSGGYAAGGVSGAPYAAGDQPGTNAGQSADSSSSPATTGSTSGQNYSNSLASNFGTSSASSSSGTNMLGDFLAGGGFGSSNIILGGKDAYGGPGVQTASPFGSHQFKVADSDSAWLRNRVFYNMNYFNNVGAGTGISRNLLGGERVLPGGNVSIGLRVPVYTVDPGIQTANGDTFGTYGAKTNTQSSFGDLAVYLKAGLHLDEANGNALSVGLAVVAPTGPSTIGGVTPIYTVNGVSHSGTIQPYLAFYKTLSGTFGEGLFAQGFVGFDLPFDSHDSTYLYNDYGLGYIFKRDRECGLTAIIPTIEAHINTPLNNLTHGITATPALFQYTGAGSISGIVSYTNQFNMTAGVTTVWNNRTTVAFGAALPVATPHPYNYELQVVVSRYFGAGRAVANLFQ